MGFGEGRETVGKGEFMPTVLLPPLQCFIALAIRFCSCHSTLLLPCYVAPALSCIIDTSPREFSAENCSMLANFGEMVVREIEKERQIQDQKVKNQVRRGVGHGLALSYIAGECS